MTGHDDDGYDGPAALTVGDRRFDVAVRIAGRFEPVDGRYRWYGRVTADPELTDTVGSGRQPALLVTAHGRAFGEVSGPDVQAGYRIEGVGVPPFEVPFSIEEVEN